MSQPTTSPILLPEILSNIARYIPLFELDTDETNHFDSYYHFTPENLYPCLLVSRLWYQCFLPHLYHYFVDSIMTQELLPRPVLQKHRPHFRRVILNNVGRQLDSDHHDLIDLPTDLLGLYVYSVDADPASHLHLLRTVCGPRLRELTWNGRSHSSRLDTRWDIIGTFSALEELELLRWHLSSDQLRTVLLGCSQTLRSLRMHTISGYGEEVFNNSTNQPPLELTALRELYLMLDWPQSRAVVHLPRICPALEVLHLNVDREEFDLRVMTENCQKHCPRLHSIQYLEGYSMRHEHGYYPEPEVYAYLIKHSTRHLRSAIIPLHSGLDSQMLDALQSQAGTLERIELRMKRGSTLDTALLASFLERATALKSLVVDKANFGVQELDQLCQQPWACRDLKTLMIQGYIPKREERSKKRQPEPEVADIKDSAFQNLLSSGEPFVCSDMAHRMYEGDGQGWYLQQGLPDWSYAKSAKERAIKKKLFEHMYSSGLHQVSRVTLNSTDLFAEEQPPPAATDSDSDSVSDSASDSESDRES
ncbi:hypothetical protein BGZ68_001990 [Mortierella alpina]|nr:hypothetical protein BGZ68_001990 [Mortierella alpina]